MTTQRTTTRTRKRPATGPVWALALVIAVVMAAVLAAVQPSGDSGQLKHTGSVNATDGDPAFVVPSPTAVPRPLSIRVALPDLDPDQTYWYRKALVVPSCPLCAGVSGEPVNLDDNAMAAWLALIWTESRYQPWAVSEVGCYGLGQLCGSLKTDETDARPEYNLYVSAREFARLLEANGGDIGAVIGQYKGVTSGDTQWQSNLVWQYVKVAP